MSRYNYLQKYAKSRPWMPSISSETPQLARTTVYAIQNQQEVSISMLESVVSLTCYFETLVELLDNPTLIEHCIICLHKREKEGVHIFDDEWGYLYFKIMVLSINASIVSKHRHPTVWDTLLSMHGKHDAAEKLSDDLDDFLSERKNDPYPDKIIGWDSSDNRVLVISKKNAFLLLDILFKDRKGLLKACSQNWSPTLTGLLFVIWRCVYITSTPECWVSFIDITRRCYLCTKADISSAIQVFQEDAHRHLELWISRRTPTAVDLEDARLQLSMLIERIRSEPGTGADDVPFILSFYFLVTFSLPQVDEHFIPGVEDMFIPLLRESFRSFWRYFKFETGFASLILRPELVKDRIGILTIMINLMLEHLFRHPTKVITMKQVVQAVADLGVVEILAKAVFFTNDYSGTNDISKITEHVRTFKKFANNVRYISQDGLGAVFRHTSTDWFKAYFFKEMQDAFFGTSIRHEEWFDTTINFWYELGASLDYISPTVDYMRNVPLCSYTRCPDPVATDMNALECGLGNIFADITSTQLFMVGG